MTPMIPVNLGNRTVAIMFSHPTIKERLNEEDIPFDSLVGFVREDFYREVRTTKCQIVELLKPLGEKMLKESDMKLLAEAVARCSVLDNFRKDVGRKIALTRAVALVGLNKHERSLLWDAYRNRN